MIQREYDAIRARTYQGRATQSDCLALLADNDRLADQLTECWLAMDAMTRQIGLDVSSLVRVLRNQKVPGWLMAKPPISPHELLTGEQPP